MMNDHENLIGCWASVAQISQNLLDLARNGEWELLLDKEEDYLRSVESVMTDQVPEISKNMQHIIEGYLKKTLENELILEELLHQRLHVLGELISQSVRQRSINTTYGGVSGLVLVPESGQDTTTH